MRDELKVIGMVLAWDLLRQPVRVPQTPQRATEESEEE